MMRSCGIRDVPLPLPLRWVRAGTVGFTASSLAEQCSPMRRGGPAPSAPAATAHAPVCVQRLLAAARGGGWLPAAHVRRPPSGGGWLRLLALLLRLLFASRAQVEREVHIHQVGAGPSVQYPLLPPSVQYPLLPPSVQCPLVASSFHRLLWPLAAPQRPPRTHTHARAHTHTPFGRARTAAVLSPVRCGAQVLRLFKSAADDQLAVELTDHIKDGHFALSSDVVQRCVRAGRAAAAPRCFPRSFPRSFSRTAHAVPTHRPRSADAPPTRCRRTAHAVPTHRPRGARLSPPARSPSSPNLGLFQHSHPPALSCVARCLDHHASALARSAPWRQQYPT
jgi:hypothetical protein